jgi:hypothetical protein
MAAPVTVFLAPGQFGASGQFFDSAGNPLALGQIFTYLAGTTTPAVTYTGPGLTQAANANPLILSPDGRPQQEIWIPQGVSMKFIVTDSLGSQVGLTWDNLSGVNDSSLQTASEWVPLGLTPTFVSSTQFTVVGASLTLVVGRRLQSVNTAGIIYNTISAVSFGGGLTTVTVIQKEPTDGLLDSGLSSVNYGILSIVNPSDPFSVNVQVFTGNGTWIKFPGAKLVEVLCIGPGGPGGGGRGAAAGAVRNGGGGGGGGSWVRSVFLASFLPATVAVSVPGSSAGGAGGSNANGGVGAGSGTTNFGSGISGSQSAAYLAGPGGGAGAGGDNASVGGGGGGGGSGGAGAAGVNNVQTNSAGPQAGNIIGFASAPQHGVGGQGGGSNSTGSGEAEYGGGGGATSSGAGINGTRGGNSLFGGAGGGCGGGLTAGNAESNGSSGGGAGWNPGGGPNLGGTAGVVSGGAGGAGATSTINQGGQGGGGGASFAAGTGGAGGAGGTPGGGGGGGGAGTTVGGAGGAGARGECRVWTYF